MIIRVVEGTVALGQEAGLSELARNTLEIRRATTPGFHHGQFGRRVIDGQTEFVWVSEWHDHVSFATVVGELSSPPTFIGRNPNLVENWSVKVFESLDESPQS
jgi:hypothetical protein